MTNYEIIETFLDIQRDTMFAELTPFPFGTMNFSPVEPSPFWNYLLTDQILNDVEIAEVEKYLQSKDRKPEIYFEVKPALEPMKDILKAKGYVFHNEDSWMFYDVTRPIGITDFSTVRRVNTVEDLAVWIQTMDKCYVDGDPQNPYGPLGENYINVAQKAWKANHAAGKFEYFIVYKKDEPVAGATLTYKNGLGYISNIGSMPSVRGEGYGKLATLFCVNEALKNGVSDVFLATEEGTYPNAFYKKIGFKTRFTGIAYVKA